MSQIISLTDAVGRTTDYRTYKEAILATNYRSQNILPLCETFDRDAFDDLLAQTGCEGVRIYFGMDSSKTVHAIIVGVNGDDEDMVDPESLTNLIIEDGRRCPEDCPPASDLNS